MPGTKLFVDIVFSFYKPFKINYTVSKKHFPKYMEEKSS